MREMNEHWIDRLSDHVEDDLSAAEREACDSHLRVCSECAGALEELRAIVAQASLLPDLPPERDLWPAIEGRLAPRGAGAIGSGEDEVGVVPIASRRRVTLTIPQLVAAAVALVVLSAGAVSLLVPGGETAPTAVAVETPAENSTPSAAPVLLTAGYEDAVRELEAEFERRRTVLDPETIRVVEQNLAIIDRAIVEANRALGEDPSNAFLSTHLASAMRQKVDLLRRVASIERTES